MSITSLRNCLCLAMALVLPFSLFADSLNGAMVHPYGAAWVNGIATERASAIFPGDSVQTSPSSILKISASHFGVTVLSDSFVKFDGDSVAIVRGGAKVATSVGTSARAGIVTVTPSSNSPTEFQMNHAAGTVQVIALKGDLQINNGFHVLTLLQGQQATQVGADQDTSNDQEKNKSKEDQDKEKKKKAPAGAATNSTPALVTVAAAAGMAAVVAVGVYIIESGPSAISPVDP